MITKAQIQNKVNNKFEVRIPLFETAGNPLPVVLTATLCYQPGNLEAYQKGDVVYVAFENGEISNPVIIGKLYTGLEKETNTYSFNASIEATDIATLPKKTSIGEFTPDEVYSTLQNNKIHEERIIELEAKVKALTELITEHNANIDNLTDSIEDVFGPTALTTQNDIQRMYSGEEITNPFTGSGIVSSQDITGIYQGEQVTDIIVSNDTTSISDIDNLYEEENK